MTTSKKKKKWHVNSVFFGLSDNSCSVDLISQSTHYYRQQFLTAVFRACATILPSSTQLVILRPPYLWLTPRLSRRESLSIASCTLYLNAVGFFSLSLSWTYNKTTPRICRPISHAKQGFFPRIRQEYQGKNSRLSTRLGQHAACSLPWGQHAFGLFDMFVTATVLHGTVGVWLSIPAILALLPRYSRWPQTDVTLRRCTALCRVKFRKIKSTVHIEQYM